MPYGRFQYYRLDVAEVRRRRRDLGLTQKQLAAVSGLTLDTIKDIEQLRREDNGVRASTLRKLCAALGNIGMWALRIDKNPDDDDDEGPPVTGNGWSDDDDGA